MKITWKQLKEAVEKSEGFYEDIEIGYIDIGVVRYRILDVYINNKRISITC